MSAAVRSASLTAMQQQQHHQQDSYTRGTACTGVSSQQQGQNYAVNNTHQETGSMVLGQYRRHTASLSAAPIRGSHFTETGGRPTRSASWAPDSPKKGRGSFGAGKSSGIAGRRPRNIIAAIVRHFEESVFSVKAIRNNRKELIGWLILLAVVVVSYKLWSDGGFSAILTLASAFQCFALALLNLKALGQRSVVGVSERSILLIVTSLCSRLISTLFWNGYLPVDRSGDWVYQVADLLSVALAISLLVYGRTACKATLQQQSDKDTCHIIIPAVAAFVFSFLVHPTLNQNALADISWTFALYLETFAMVPQLWLMAKLGGEVEALTSHYVASMASSKVFAWLFWYFSFSELGPRNGGRNWAGWAVILSYTLQTLLFGDFF